MDYLIFESHHHHFPKMSNLHESLMLESYFKQCSTHHSVRPCKKKASHRAVRGSLISSIPESGILTQFILGWDSNRMNPRTVIFFLKIAFVVHKN